MNEEHPLADDQNVPVLYEIRMKGHLDRRWAGWFEGLTITLEKNGETVLTGPGLDQAALPHLLRKMGDLGITVLSVSFRKENV